MTTGVTYPGFFPIVEVYQPLAGFVGELGAARTRNGAALTSVPAGGAQFGTLRLKGKPWFTLNNERGVGVGGLEVWASAFDADYGVSPLQEGDIVVFRPEAGVEWARLFVRRPIRREFSWEYGLEGESQALMGRPATTTEIDPARQSVLTAAITADAGTIPVANTDNWGYPGVVMIDSEVIYYDGLGAGPTLTGLQRGCNGTTPAEHKIDTAVVRNKAGEWIYYPDTAGGILADLMLRALDYYASGGGHVAEWHSARRIDEQGCGTLGNLVKMFQIDKRTVVADAIKDLAGCRQGDEETPIVWGIGNGMWGAFTAGTDDEGRAFFFGPRPDSAAMVLRPDAPAADRLTVGGAAVTLLQFPEWRAGDFYNCVEVKGRKGCYAEWKDSDSIDAHQGVQSVARLEVPTLRSSETALLFAKAFVKRHAWPKAIFEPLRFIVPAADKLPLPWGGYCQVVTNSAYPDEKYSIKHVRIYFGEQPEAEVTIGEVERTNPFVARNGQALVPGVPFFAAMQQVRRTPDEADEGAAVATGGTTVIEGEAVFEPHGHDEAGSGHLAFFKR